MGLDGVYAALGQMERHGPVVGDGVDHVLHAGVNGGLGGPDMGADDRDVLGHVLVHGGHELGVLLVGAVVAELAEALVVHGLPDQLVEQLALLGDAGAHGVQVVLCADDLGAGGVGVGVQVHPVGLIAQGMGGGGHGHRDAVVAEAHADVAHDDTLFGIKGGVALAVLDADVPHAQRGADVGVLHHDGGVGRPGVVAELAGEFCLGLLRLAVVAVGHQVAEDDLGLVLHTLSSFYCSI